MFERYSESARQVIFSARCEAGILGSSLVEPEHLLLGLLREDEHLLRVLPGDAPEAIRADIEKHFARSEVTSTSVDLPLGFPAKCVLAYGAEEAERLNHKVVEPGHLTLGLLHMEDCMAAKILRSHGIASESLRSIVRDAPPAPPGLEAARQSAYLGDAIAALENLLGQTRKHLKRYADSYGELPLAGKPWKRKEALGHLVDWATAHQMWFARALTEPALVTRGYPPVEWASAQKYENHVWQEIVDLWVSLNGLLIHVLAQIPEGKLDLQCRIGLGEPVSLSELIESYVQHCQEIVQQITTHP